MIHRRTPQGLPGEGSPRSAPETVYDDLRARILHLELAPDAVLSRAGLAEEYGVSLTPIREALQALEQDGLVRIRPQSGTVVTRIDLSELEQAHFLRVAVETEVVRRLAPLRDAALVQRLRGLLALQEALVGDTAQMDIFSELDRRFHRTLFEAAGVAGIHHMVARRMGHLTRCQRLELPRSGKMASVVADHRAVVAALAEGDAEAAVAAMRRHLAGTISRVGGLQAAFPEYFTGTAGR
jgi:DNA-binding GntR family transcriptional regulator